jgi:hypothetical protein
VAEKRIRRFALKGEHRLARPLNFLSPTRSTKGDRGHDGFLPIYQYDLARGAIGIRDTFLVNSIGKI